MIEILRWSVDDNIILSKKKFVKLIILCIIKIFEVKNSLK